MTPIKTLVGFLGFLTAGVLGTLFIVYAGRLKGAVRRLMTH